MNLGEQRFILFNFRILPALLIFALLLVLALGARFWVLQMLAAQTLNCRLCVVPGMLKADLPMVAVLTGIFLLSYAVRQRAWVFIWRAIAFTGLVVYLTDMVVMTQFYTRLMVSDVRVYLGEPQVVVAHLSTFGSLQLILGIFGLMALCVICLTLPQRSLSWRPLLAGLSALVGFALTAHLALPAPGYVHDWAVRNVFDVNLPSGIDRDYGSNTRKMLSQLASEPGIIKCVPGRAKRGPVVLLLLESWSPYHSKFWSGLNDWTPRLDAMAQDNIHFLRLHAGGFNTNEALVSLFTGRDFVLPMKLPHHFEAFDGAWGIADTSPRRLETEGYHTVFLTSGNLAFTQKGEWLREIGFTYVEGHDFPGYEGLPRHHFESVPDDALYERALEVIVGLREKGTSAFTVIENVSTHHPFIHPYTGERSEEAVFRFMDETVADFIEALQRTGFFDDGLLLVTSDHRAMTMVPATEKKLLGRAAASLVPTFVMTGEVGGHAISMPFHQADLMPTLSRHVGAEFCYEGPLRDLLEPNSTEARCVIHARGDRRNHLDVFCEKGEGTVQVAGDDSAFIEVDGLDPDLQRVLLNRIAWERIEAAARSQ